MEGELIKISDSLKKINSNLGFVWEAITMAVMVLTVLVIVALIHFW